MKQKRLRGHYLCSHMIANACVDSRVFQDHLKMVVTVDHPGQLGAAGSFMVQGGRHLSVHEVDINFH